MKRLTVILCALLLGPLALAAAEPAAMTMKVLRLDYVVVAKGVDSRGRPLRRVLTRTRFIAPDGRVRTETHGSGLLDQKVEILDKSADELVVLDLNSKKAVRRRAFEDRIKAGVPVMGGQVPQRGEKHDLGATTIQGYECQGYRNTWPNDYWMEHWVCREPVSGENFFGSTRGGTPDGTATSEEDLKKATPGFEVDPQIFEIPPDFHVVEQ